MQNMKFTSDYVAQLRQIEQQMIALAQLEAEMRKLSIAAAKAADGIAFELVQVTRGEVLEVPSKRLLKLARWARSAFEKVSSELVVVVMVTFFKADQCAARGDLGCVDPDSSV